MEILTIITVLYVTVATVVFFAYDSDPMRIRLKITIIAPILLVVGGLKWIAKQLEELG